MTRTARASYPNAIAKDRSEAKNGKDKHIPKGGAGTHNWGRLEDELELENAAFEDEQAEFEEATGVSVNEAAEQRSVPGRRGSSLTPEEVQQGIEFRKKALKSPDVDLGSIARTAPAISTSPSQPTSIVTDADTNTIAGGALKQ
ncbi:hypothetical protein L226DRAFT_576721 [Lentinus tigrinus ALCF2SS1-7]|uniref:Hyaluronan/mRNA-binding protein domain-containing protein n=1 Tax=Lentinus tigrinus ALCF2SS1-6 TaxID=1328759 RepID=A0A5C2SBL6_9APHY|nr:hypothetical protein L227DRAFT_547690 [Lentinus tigrinus ALCF2SS1-6]RPD68063.1 hypothetical protein L226DRAFT_576721 [Lentinus tigrinus ALCF2SS1-7]